ncbi:MAG: MBL fold metallo-hydrolase [Candidatus Nanohaloarchaea archaeon]
MKIEVLGNMQDGGVPHLGCKCDTCESARNKGNQKRIASLLLKEDEGNSQARYLIDATPDIRYQFDGQYLDGIFLSQDGIGHMTGLLYLGKESYDYSGIPVYTSPETHEFMQKNDPYRFLIDRGNIEINEIDDGDEQQLQGASIEVKHIEHPQVETKNFCFVIDGEHRKLVYIVDINEWRHGSRELVEEADVAIVDGTFWSSNEIDRFEEVPHPTIQKTMDEFEDTDTDIYFTHLNHTNPVLREESEERQQMEDMGFWIVEKGMEFEI